MWSFVLHKRIMASAAFSSITYISICHIAHKREFFFCQSYTWKKFVWFLSSSQNGTVLAVHIVTSVRNKGKTGEITKFLIIMKTKSKNWVWKNLGIVAIFLKVIDKINVSSIPWKSVEESSHFPMKEGSYPISPYPGTPDITLFKG